MCVYIYRYAIDYAEEAKRQLDNEIYYKKIERDLTSEHEQLINQCIDTYKNNGEIAKLLKPVRSRTPIFYMPPKIQQSWETSSILRKQSHEDAISLCGLIFKTFSRKTTVLHTRYLTLSDNCGFWASYLQGVS